MRFLSLVTIFAAVAITATHAEVVIEDETQAQEATASGAKATKRAAKLTPEELKAKKEEKKRRNRKLESCLILTRAYYGQNQKMFQNYIEGHAATKAGAEDDAKAKKQAQANQQSLVAVMNADQLIQCEENIDDQ